MDYVDLYIIHRFDYATPLEETLETLNDVVRAGKVRYLGASSMHAWQFMKALGLQRAHGWASFVSMQNYYNLLYREDEREMLDLCRQEGIGITPWSPLARGRLARPWTDEPQTDRAKTDIFGRILYEKTAQLDKMVVERLGEIAQQRGDSMSQVALAWLLQKPGIASPIIGATKSHHLNDAVKAITMKLSAEEISRLEELYQPHAATEGVFIARSAGDQQQKNSSLHSRRNTPYFVAFPLCGTVRVLCNRKSSNIDATHRAFLCNLYYNVTDKLKLLCVFAKKHI